VAPVAIITESARIGSSASESAYSFHNLNGL